jgi:hypothetical protein
VGLRAGQDTEAGRKIFTSAGDRTPVVRSVIKHYTDWAKLYFDLKESREHRKQMCLVKQIHGSVVSPRA